MRYLVVLLLIPAGVVCAQQIPDAKELRKAADTTSRTATALTAVDHSDALKWRLLRGSLETTYISLGGRGGDAGPLIFEGNIAPHLTYAGPRWAFVATPKLVLRMLRGPSAPVRSPSFMPRAALYRWDDSPETREDARRRAATSVLISHHSNGQDGAFWTDTAARQVNQRDGSFSTNFVELNRLWFFRDSIRSGGHSRPTYLWRSLGLRAHLPVNESAELRDYDVGREQYGRYRILASASSVSAIPFIGPAIKRISRNWVPDASLSVATQYMLDKRVVTSEFFNRHRFIGSGSFAIFPRQLTFGAYLQYYVGQDYYNMMYTTQLSVLRFGFTTSSVTSLREGFGR